MAAGKHGSAEFTISCDDAPGGTLRAITPYVTSIGGIKITAATQVTTAFGDTWTKNSPTGIKKVEAIKIGGFFDDTATVGPHVVFLTPDTTIYDGTTATSRTLTVVVANTPKTFTVEVLLTSYTVMGKNGNLTEYEAELLPTGTGTWS
jgi:hypothetical protein